MVGVAWGPQAESSAATNVGMKSSFFMSGLCSVMLFNPDPVLIDIDCFLTAGIQREISNELPAPDPGYILAFPGRYLFLDPTRDRVFKDAQRAFLVDALEG